MKKREKEKKHYITIGLTRYWALAHLGNILVSSITTHGRLKDYHNFMNVGPSSMTLHLGLNAVKFRHATSNLRKHIGIYNNNQGWEGR